MRGESRVPGRRAVLVAAAMLALLALAVTAVRSEGDASAQTQTGPGIVLVCPAQAELNTPFTCDVLFEAAPEMTPHRGFQISIMHPGGQVRSVEGSFEASDETYPGGNLVAQTNYNVDPATDPGGDERSGDLISRFIVLALPSQDVESVGVVARLAFICQADGAYLLRLRALGWSATQGTYTIDPGNQPHVNALTHATVACGSASPDDEVANPGPEGDEPTPVPPPATTDGDTGTTDGGDGATTGSGTTGDADVPGQAGDETIGGLGSGDSSGRSVGATEITIAVIVLVAAGAALVALAPRLRRRFRAGGG